MAPRQPAFMYYPKDWKGSKWVRFNIDTLDRMPSDPGCYVIYADGVVIYVGQAINVFRRLRAYNFRYGYGRAQMCSFESEPTFTCGELSVKVRFADRYGDWAMRELRLIKRLKPRFNCVGGGMLRRKTNAR